MRQTSKRRYHDDEALAQYLRIDRSVNAWQVVYDFYKKPVYFYFKEINYTEEQIKPIWTRAFAELLEDIHSSSIKTPLSFSLLDLLLAYCLKVDTTGKTTGKSAPPAGYSRIAKKIIVNRLQQTNKELITQAIYECFKEPALKMMQARYSSIQKSELEDAFQEAILGLLANPPLDKKGTTEGKLFTYFMRILGNKIQDVLVKKDKKDLPAGDLENFNSLLNNLADEQSHKNNDFWDYITEAYGIGEKFGSDNDLDLIDKLLATISSNCRNLLELRFIEEKKFKEIAPIIDCSIDSIGQRIKRCLKKIKSIL